MIGVIFDFGGEVVEVRIDGINCFFRTSQFGNGFAPLDGIHIDHKGVLKEFPDLEGRDDWKIEAIKRFKSKLNDFKTEKERMNYVIQDLSKFGYIPLYYQVQGFRPKRIR